MAWLDDGLSVSIAQLRIEEALAVEKADLRDNGAILRVYQQATRDGRETAPLKKRKRGEYRDIPVPTWLWDMIRDLPDGPVMTGNGERRYQLYGTVYERFMNAADKAGIPAGFTPHSLRHAFASAMLSKGVPITDVAHWLGHRDVTDDVPDLRSSRAIGSGTRYRGAGRGIRGMEQAGEEVRKFRVRY